MAQNFDENHVAEMCEMPRYLVVYKATNFRLTKKIERARLFKGASELLFSRYICIWEEFYMNMIKKEHFNAFRDTLLAGGYNLLFGSGISLDSRNGNNEPLKDTENLRKTLCKVAEVKEETSLTRVYALMTPEQKQKELIDAYSNCVPGPSLMHLPKYLWRRLFTFNIDDVIENLYSNAVERKQKLQPIMFDSQFEPTPGRMELHSIHLHGWVRSDNKEFVFSNSEYAKIMRGLNPWMHMLSEILATEPFIIAGTSLNEIDVEYYLSHRSPATPRRGRGPSFLIEPFPDRATESDCNRYGLILIKGFFSDFLSWLNETFPDPPGLSNLIVPEKAEIFQGIADKRQLVRFFSDFEYIEAVDRELPTLPSPFLYGREPDWKDIHQHLDIERNDNQILVDRVRPPLGPAAPGKLNIFLVLDDAGTGKSTLLKRVAHDIAKSGAPVLSLRTLSKIDIDTAVNILSSLRKKCVIIIDGLADHIEQVVELIENSAIANNVIFICAERRYRKEHLDHFIDPLLYEELSLQNLSQDENVQLIERYRRFGLVAEPRALANTAEFARLLHHQPIACAICLILNDFRPIEAILESLWNESDQKDRRIYLCVALAQHCYRSGINYNILRSLMEPSDSLDRLFGKGVPLKLAENTSESDYVVVLNSLIGERILYRSQKREKITLYSAFVDVASALAPYVTRQSIISRSPEAKLAGRLFDADKIVKPLLNNEAERFYIDTQNEWEWNSRYWEQRALLTAENDVDRAIQYARHAIALEYHPFPLTTLGKLIFWKMEGSTQECGLLFNEAFDLLRKAIDQEQIKFWRKIHPYVVILKGVIKFRQLGGELNNAQNLQFKDIIFNAKRIFRKDKTIDELLSQL